MKIYILRFNITTRKTLTLKTLILQNIVVNNWSQLVIKSVLETADVPIFNDYSKLDLYYILKRRYHVIKAIHPLYSLDALK